MGAGCGYAICISEGAGGSGVADGLPPDEAGDFGEDEGAGCGCGDFEPHGEFEGDGAEECAGILDDEDLQDEGAAGGDQHGAV